jgi:hypothetical protein
MRFLLMDEEDIRSFQSTMRRAPMCTPMLTSVVYHQCYNCFKPFVLASFLDLMSAPRSSKHQIQDYVGRRYKTPSESTPSRHYTPQSN